MSRRWCGPKEGVLNRETGGFVCMREGQREVILFGANLRANEGEIETRLMDWKKTRDDLP
jgi:hypothetical protein